MNKARKIGDLEKQQVLGGPRAGPAPARRVPRRPPRKPLPGESDGVPTADAPGGAHRRRHGLAVSEQHVPPAPSHRITEKERREEL